MVDEEKKEEENANDETQTAVDPKKGWRRFVTKKNTIIVVVVTLSLQFGAFLLFQFADFKSAENNSNEYSLGHFHFTSNAKKNIGIQRADFDLHIILLPEMSRYGRVQLENQKFKIQQDVQELLRLAAAGDFADPRLVEIKRQLQEQINQTLTHRVIEEVIITNLVVIDAEAATVSKKVNSKKDEAAKLDGSKAAQDQTTNNS